MSEYRVATRYAKSLLSLADDQGVLDKVHADMQLFLNVCAESRDLFLLLKNPIIKHDKKRAVLQKIFEGKVSQLTIAFFDIITRKNREAVLPEMAKEFDHQYNVYKGIEEATVTTAIPLTKELKAEVEKLVKKISSKSKVELTELVDEDLIGGYILKVADRQIDDSIKSKLKALELKFSQNPYIKEF
ncbi:MAG: ATP synthase F1 subunit delta [Bacteroidota bacterium]